MGSGAPAFFSPAPTPASQSEWASRSSIHTQERGLASQGPSLSGEQPTDSEEPSPPKQVTQSEGGAVT